MLILFLMNSGLKLAKTELKIFNESNNFSIDFGLLNITYLPGVVSNKYKFYLF